MSPKSNSSTSAGRGEMITSGVDDRCDEEILVGSRHVVSDAGLESYQSAVVGSQFGLWYMLFSRYSKR